MNSKDAAVELLDEGVESRRGASRRRRMRRGEEALEMREEELKDYRE